MISSFTRISTATILKNLRSFSSASDVFTNAQAQLKTLKEEPDNTVKLQLYALFKQASAGDVTGSRPGMMDFVGRAKFDAWANHKGTSQEDAKRKYAELVGTLVKDNVSAPPSATIDDLTAVNGLDVSREGKVFQVTLNRPTKFNALTLDMYRGIIAALEASNKDTSTSITVISAVGNYYCSGNDLTNFAKAASASKEEIRKMAEEAGVVLQQYVQAYIDHEKPLIGIINGPAVGIAVTVLPLFNYVLSTDKATFNTPFATLGQSPEGASSYTFPLLMGQLRADNVLLFGKKLTADNALSYGLVSEVVPHDELAKHTEKILASYSNLPPESLRINKKLLRSIHKDALTKTNEEECRTIIGRWQSKECAQAIASFLTRSKKRVLTSEMVLLSDPDDGPDKVRVQVVEGRGVHVRVNNHSANEFTQRQLINRQVTIHDEGVFEKGILRLVRRRHPLPGADPPYGEHPHRSPTPTEHRGHDAPPHGGHHHFQWLAAFPAHLQGLGHVDGLDGASRRGHRRWGIEPPSFTMSSLT